MLPTARKFSEHTPCPLCGAYVDSTKHMLGQCEVAAHASAAIYKDTKNNNTNLSFLRSACADQKRNKEEICLQLFLSHSIWRARDAANKGVQKNIQAWGSWIYTDCITRISKKAPAFFSLNFPNNNIPNRYKITYNPNLGSAKQKSDIPGIAEHAVNAHMAMLPPDSLIAFTDGSANPNPGPAGAGAVIMYKNNNNKIIHIASYTAALGFASNNTGEVYAAGMVLEHCKLTNHKGNIHIYTDSRVTHGALTNGWRAGANNASILYAVRDIAHKLRHQCNINFHWIPGHAGIAHNDTADRLANAGTSYSSSQRNENINFKHSINNTGFMGLVTETHINQN
jgi:ribonuclease HI